MANQVYANNMEVSCKAANGKSVAAFPDVCFTPPQTPATPPGVPIPYPNTGLASDTTNGSRSVKISKKEVMLKNKSYFKKSYGDEAGCAPKKGVITSRNMGKVYFNAWSMNVRIEGENAVRMMDITTHNHGSCPGNTPPMVYIDEAVVGLEKFGTCGKEKQAIQTECKENKGNPCPGMLSGKTQPTTDYANRATQDANSSECAKAMKCFLRPYKTNGKYSCCDGQTGHHIPPWETTKSTPNLPTSLTHENALCICLEGRNHSMGSHGKNHHGINYLTKKIATTGSNVFTHSKNGRNNLYTGCLKHHVAVAAAVTHAQTNCSKECIEEQLKSQFREEDLEKSTVHNATATGGESYGRLTQSDKSSLTKTATSWNQVAKDLEIGV